MRAVVRDEEVLNLRQAYRTDGIDRVIERRIRLCDCGTDQSIVAYCSARLGLFSEQDADRLDLDKAPHDERRRGDHHHVQRVAVWRERAWDRAEVVWERHAGGQQPAESVAPMVLVEFEL